jgi:DNA-binding transcriptional MerR regulator/mannose-6-phosphate isomerase-like protein (cupin superfamily)
MGVSIQVSNAEADAPHLRIGEVAHQVGVSPSTVRAWEREGFVSPTRGPGGHRLYTLSDVHRLRRVHHFIEQGYNHRALHDMLDGVLPMKEGLVGTKLRAMRASRGLSLRKAAQAADISQSYLSLVERGMATCSVAMLKRIVNAYGSTLLEFFDDSPEHIEDGVKCKLVRAGEGRRQSFDSVMIEELVCFPNTILQIEIVTIEPGSGSGGEYKHEGEEVMFVLQGHIQVWLDGTECYDLKQGDMLYFQSTQLHRWHNPGKEPARYLGVNTPPTF